MLSMMIQTAVCCCVIITILILQQTSAASDSKFHHHSPKLREYAAKIDRFVSRSRSSPVPVRPPPQVGGVFYPIGYGADPTGHNDSSNAIQNALNDAFKQLDDEKVYLMDGIKDLGGAIIDLQGGRYLITKPITFPPSGGGNLLIKEGSLRASQGFPSDRSLVELIAPKKSEVLINKTTDVGELQGKGSYYEDITFRDLMFDSGFRGGGLMVVDAVRTRIINSYFLNFTSQGILVQGGHETFIEKCFIGQRPTIGSHKEEEHFSGTGIDLASNDNVITDTVIFAAQIGLLVRGQANMITGLHTYNKSWIFGGIGILMKVYAAYNRIVNCFIDYNPVVLEDPYFVLLTNNFFLGHAYVVLKSVNGRATGLTIANNFYTGFKGAETVKLEGEFNVIHDVVIEQNQARNMTMKSTAAKKMVAGKGTKWVADFSEELLFPNKIEHFQYSFVVLDRKKKTNGGAWGGPRFPIHAATNVSGNVVVVESEDEVDAIVSVAVDQFNPITKNPNDVNFMS
ncbi:Polygalacturonase QRT3 [Linum perenne]